MKIFVAVKQVPDTETRVKIGADQKSLDTSSIKWVLNPYDEFAVEESIKTKDKSPGSTTTALTLGPAARVAEALRTCIAMGIDEGISIDSAEALDPFATAQALSLALQKEGGCDLLFTGKLAIDDNSFAVPQMVAQILGWPHVTGVSKLEIQGQSVRCERDIEGGAKEIVEAKLPCVISANKGLNTPRYASLPGIMKAKKKTLKTISLSELNAPASGTWKIESLTLPPEKPPAKLLNGDVSTQVGQLVLALRDEAKVL